MTAPTRNYDPFAPAPAGFPERRLRRAGLDDAAIAQLRTRFGEMVAEQRRELSRFVARNPDRVVRDRFASGRTREDLEELHVDDLQDLLRERPGGLSTTGRKAELVDRLLASYSGTDAPAPAPVPDEAPEGDSGQTAATTGTGAGAPDAPPAGATTPTPTDTETPDATTATGTTTQEETTRG